MNTILVKINKSFDGFTHGQEIKIACHPNGIAKSRQWRRRLRDAETDNCCEVVKPKSKQKPKSESKEFKNEG